MGDRCNSEWRKGDGRGDKSYDCLYMDKGWKSRRGGIRRVELAIAGAMAVVV